MAKFVCYMSSYDDGITSLAGRKKDKKRLSMALCANADGLHKLNPRCFKHVNIRKICQ